MPKTKNTPFSGLKKIPLLRRALADPYIKIQTRAICKDWFYYGYIPFSVSAFNPSHRTIYIAHDSSIAQWIRNGTKNDRTYNQSGLLLKEACYLIHDYLHCWAYLMIQDIMPNIKFGCGDIKEKNVEDYAFCHLVTEAVARVGLDYWYLSTLDINDLCDLGTNQGPLTVGYHDKYLREYRKFSPSFNVQTPSMFKSVVKFYCNGEFNHFSLNDLKRSPLLESWLHHEFRYGEMQRIYTRQWLAYLSGDKLNYSTQELKSKITINKQWQKNLIDILGNRLWNLVKNDQPHLFKTKPKNPAPWKKRENNKHPNFRFTNLNRFNLKNAALIKAQPDYEEHFKFFYSQFLSTFSFKHVPNSFFPILKSILKDKNLDGLITLTKIFRLKKCLGPRSEPIDLFFLS